MSERDVEVICLDDEDDDIPQTNSNRGSSSNRDHYNTPPRPAYGSVTQNPRCTNTEARFPERCRSRSPRRRARPTSPSMLGDSVFPLSLTPPPPPAPVNRPRSDKTMDYLRRPAFEKDDDAESVIQLAVIHHPIPKFSPQRDFRQPEATARARPDPPAFQSSPNTDIPHKKSRTESPRQSPGQQYQTTSTTAPAPVPAPAGIRRITPVMVSPTSTTSPRTHFQNSPSPKPKSPSPAVTTSTLGSATPPKKSTVSMAVQTDEVVAPTSVHKIANRKLNSSPQRPSSSVDGNTQNKQKSDNDPVESLVNELTQNVGKCIKGRIKKNFKPQDSEKVMKILKEAIKNIKPDSTPSRAMLALLAAIDANNFPYELERLWRKDVEKRKVLEKEDKVFQMVQDLKEVEAKLDQLHEKQLACTITQIEQQEYEELAKELGLKYFAYKKILGNGCSIRAELYSNQVQKIDLSHVSTGFIEANNALQDYMNLELAKFLECSLDYDGICIPEFPKVKEVVTEALKDNVFQIGDDIIYKIACTLYEALKNIIQQRRYSDLWAGLLALARFPTLALLESADPAIASPALRALLESNRETAIIHLAEVFNRFDETTVPDQDNLDLDVEPRLNESSGELEDDPSYEHESSASGDSSSDGFIDSDATVPVKKVSKVSIASLFGEDEDNENSGSISDAAVSSISMPGPSSADTTMKPLDNESGDSDSGED